MTTRYFDIKTATKKFEEDLLWTLGEIADKKVVLFGDIDVYNKLKDKFHLDNLNVVAYSDNNIGDGEKSANGFDCVQPEKIYTLDFDVILVLSENPMKDKEFLSIDLNLGHKGIKFVFNTLLPEEFELCNYLERIKFNQNLDKLANKFYGKTVVIYGAGKLFDVINRYYDLSKLNIVGICDEKFENHYENDNYFGYKVLNIEEVKSISPDCVLVATKEYIKVMEMLVYTLLKDTGILIKPLAKKSFIDVMKEIWL